MPDGDGAGSLWKNMKGTHTHQRTPVASGASGSAAVAPAAVVKKEPGPRVKKEDGQEYAQVHVSSRNSNKLTLQILGVWTLCQIFVFSR